MSDVENSSLEVDLSAESKSSTTRTFGMDVDAGFGGCVGAGFGSCVGAGFGGCVDAVVMGGWAGRAGGLDLPERLGFLPKQRKPILS